MEFNHVSVLLDECMKALSIKPDGVYIDGTLGGGGHSLEICKRLTTGRLIGIDRDTDAICAAKEKLCDYKSSVTFVNGNFTDIVGILDTLKIKSADGFLLDLGVSSFQLDNPERGFSYMSDSGLDMRMDRGTELSAYEVVNNYSLDKLMKILYEYGEEKYTGRIVKLIARERTLAPIETTGRLVQIIESAIPKKARIEGSHPAKRTFQAIRIEVNTELANLKKAIFDMSAALNCGGRIAIVSFHSLEDRIVKTAFRELSRPCTCPRDFPVCVCNKKPQGTVQTTKPILPSQEELSVNRRSKSAKLRVFERNGEAVNGN